MLLILLPLRSKLETMFSCLNASFFNWVSWFCHKCKCCKPRKGPRAAFGGWLMLFPQSFKVPRVFKFPNRPESIVWFRYALGNIVTKTHYEVISFLNKHHYFRSNTCFHYMFHQFSYNNSLYECFINILKKWHDNW